MPTYIRKIPIILVTLLCGLYSPVYSETKQDKHPAFFEVSNKPEFQAEGLGEIIEKIFMKTIPVVIVGIGAH